jgi:hypothetical protein
MKKLLVMLAVVASLLSPLALSPALVSANFSSSEAKNQACSGINGCTSASSLDKVIKAALNILSAVAGIAAVIMIVVAGFKYITSGGDGGKVSSAKTTLVYAIVGIIIVAMSQFIAQFVIQKSTMAPVNSAVVEIIKRT